MNNENSFNQKRDGEALSMQFRVEVADGNQGRFFDIRPLGQGRFEILEQEGSIGTIQLDEVDHAHCESQGCELDLPLLHAIRDQIQFHLQLKS